MKNSSKHLTLKKIILDLLFPANCIICEHPGSYLCGKCHSSIPVKKTDFCPICEKTEAFAGRVCNICENQKGKIFLDGIIVASYYRHPVLQEAIYRYKYNFVRGLAWPLSRILWGKITALPDFPFAEFTLSAVPLHPKRKSWRGFNQSELLVKKLHRRASQKNIPVRYLPNILVRKTNTKPQMKIKSFQKRKANIAHCFALNEVFRGELPAKILLIDDIVTTGATLEECARVLKKHGVQKVWGLVLGRQS